MARFLPKWAGARADLVSGGRVHQVDALRGLAALLIAVVYHNFYMGGQPLHSGPLDSLPPFRWLYLWGWTLVDLFFVISGFIFAHVYLGEDGRLKPGVTVRDFAAARFARLYPLHLLTLLICAALIVTAARMGMPDYRTSTARAFIENLLFLQVWHGGFNNVGWSLSVEALCYALFIFCARAGVLIRFAPIFIPLGFSMCLSEGLPDWVGRGLLGFFIGYELWRYRRVRVPTLVLVAILVCAPLLPDSLWIVDYHVLLDFTVWPALLLLALRVPAPVPLRWLGDRSYSIYLIHMPIYYAVHVAMVGAPIPPLLQLPAMLLASIAILSLANLSYVHFETPARQLLRRRSSASANVGPAPPFPSEA